MAPRLPRGTGAETFSRSAVRRGGPPDGAFFHRGRASGPDLGRAAPRKQHLHLEAAVLGVAALRAAAHELADMDVAQQASQRKENAGGFDDDGGAATELTLHRLPDLFGCRQISLRGPAATVDDAVVGFDNLPRGG